VKWIKNYLSVKFNTLHVQEYTV